MKYYLIQDRLMPYPYGYYMFSQWPGEGTWLIRGLVDEWWEQMSRSSGGKWKRLSEIGEMDHPKEWESSIEITDEEMKVFKENIK